MQKFIVCIFLCFSCSQEQVEPLKLNIFGDFSDVIVNYGIESRIFQKYGFEVESYFTNNGEEALKLLLNDELEFAIMSPFVCIENVLKGADIKYLASIGSSELPYSVISLTEKNIRNMKDLEGKRIAVQKGTQAHFYIHYALVYNEIDPDTVEFLSVLPSEAVNALQNGNVDVIFVSEPYITKARTELEDRISYFESNLRFNLALGIVVKNEYSIDKAVRLIESFEHIHLELANLIKDNPEEYARIANIPVESLDYISKFVEMGVSLDHLLILTSESQVRWLQMGTKDSDYDISTVFDSRAIDKAIPGRSSFISQ